jgi:hypothetical protein
MSQSTTVPSGQGFATSLKMDCTTADASLSASDYLIVRHIIRRSKLTTIKIWYIQCRKFNFVFLG